MELTIFGSGTGVPSLKRSGPSILVRTQGKNLLIDTGVGTLQQMLRMGLTCCDIDLILYTHTHPDHTSELVPFLFACKSHAEQRHSPLMIIGGKGFLHFFEKLQAVYGDWIRSDSFDLSISELVDSELAYEDIRLITTRTLHIKESVGYRIESEGKTVVISGDTGYCESIVNLARKADLLILECSMPDGKKIEGHLTPSLTARIANEAGCDRLILVHIYPACDVLLSEAVTDNKYPCEVIIGRDLMRIKVLGKK